jgi:hypothetical protein
MKLSINFAIVAVLGFLVGTSTAAAPAFALVSPYSSIVASACILIKE